MGGDGGSIPKRADVVRTSGYRFIRNLGGLGYLPNSQVISLIFVYPSKIIIKNNKFFFLIFIRSNQIQKNIVIQNNVIFNGKRVI
jgi:hypothetical protein